ncbi:putative F-box/FBD/LRR-repeat protein At5g22670 [Trifolium pratense]|nr:putative F-box/FBD/LRR-repeat protein At5g22670 [Trifolium pratense]
MFEKKKKIEEISSSMESNVHFPYLLLGSKAYLIDDASISSSLQNQRHKPINKDIISDLRDNILHHIPHNIFHLVEKKRLDILIPQVFLDEHTITSLVTSLLALKLEHLTFIIQDVRYLNTSCVLPSGFSASHLLSKLTLKVGGYTLYIPTGVQFPGLKTLNLYYATFANEEAVEQFFSGCPVLEELSLNYCYWLYIKQITIAIPTLRILSIRFDPHCLNCDDFSKVSVKIDVVNLLYLTCISDPSMKFVIANHLTSMVDAYISFNSLVQFHTKEYMKYFKYRSQCAVALLSGLASVKSLALSQATIEESRFENHFDFLPEFSNLTHLTLQVDSKFARKTFTQILSRCPKLEVLVFPLGIYSFTDNHDWTSIPLPGCFKSSLKKLHISRFDGSEWEIRFVEFFLENATVLEEFQISLSRRPCSKYNLKNLEDLKNRFVGMGSCVIKFRLAELLEKEDTLWKRHYGF